MRIDLEMLSCGMARLAVDDDTRPALHLAERWEHYADRRPFCQQIESENPPSNPRDERPGPTGVMSGRNVETSQCRLFRFLEDEFRFVLGINLKLDAPDGV